MDSSADFLASFSFVLGKKISDNEKKSNFKQISGLD